MTQKIEELQGRACEYWWLREGMLTERYASYRSSSTAQLPNVVRANLDADGGTACIKNFGEKSSKVVRVDDSISWTYL